jgi:hypothetical protein
MFLSSRGTYKGKFIIICHLVCRDRCLKADFSGPPAVYNNSI